jgi:hypothetical protein
MPAVEEPFLGEDVAHNEDVAERDGKARGGSSTPRSLYDL